MANPLHDNPRSKKVSDDEEADKKRRRRKAISEPVDPETLADDTGDMSRSGDNPVDKIMKLKDK